MHKRIVVFLVLVALLIVPWSAQPGFLLNTARGASVIDVWWPTQNAVLLGSVPFKALLENQSLGQYQMFWQVDGGQWNWMDDTYTDYPHKEALVDVSGWNWKGSGPYALNFIARDINGNIIAQQPVTVFTNNEVNSSSSITTATTVTTTEIFYTNPNSQAAQWAATSSQSDLADARLMQKIADQPTAFWFGTWNSNVQSDVNAVVNA
ncbi:MAG: hypothetical protein ACREHG_07100, partial [Candidatus Saccharimonadales bacterium]